MRSSSRLFIEDANRYYNALETAGIHDVVRQDIHTFGTSILLHPINTVAAENAINDITGTKIINNYQGTSVLSSYRPIHINGVNWAIVTEIEKKEAFSGVQSFVEWMIWSGVILLCLVFFIAWRFAGVFTRPILALQQAARKVADGDDSVRLPETRKDEFGALATAFNQMTGNIQSSKRSLKKERDTVQQRVERAVAEAEEQQHYLNAQVSRMLDVMNRFSHGDLTVALEGIRNDEISRLFSGFTSAVGTVRTMLQSVQQVAVSAQNSATQINGIMEELLTGSRTQTAHIQETTTALHQIIETVNENAKSTTKLSNTASRCTEAAENGNASFQTVVNQIQEISTDVNNAEEIITKLGESSNRIGSVIEVINDIADQTNLLALNAAIEAARAGEKGKGFAVVADEVRKLAEHTAYSTKEVLNIVQEIQSHSTAAVTAMSKGQKRVNEGQLVASEAKQSLKAINSMIETLVDEIHLVASATEEQAVMSSQITESIRSISESANESTTKIIETTASVSDLTKTTKNLYAQVEKFKLNETNSSLANS